MTTEKSESEAKGNGVLADVMLRFFADWLQRNQFMIMKKNPTHRAGQGYSPNKYIEYSMTEIMEMFERYAGKKM